MHTLIAVFQDDDGELLAYVVVPGQVDLGEILHSQSDEDEIRTYAVHIDSTEFKDIDEGLDFLSQVNVVDHENMPDDDSDLSPFSSYGIDGRP